MVRGDEKIISLGGLVKLVANERFSCRDTPISKQCIAAFEEVYKRYNDKLSILIQQSELVETHLDPVVCVFENSSKEIISQIFNFIDTMGGKDQINPDEVERFLQVRGILEPTNGDYKQVLKYKKDEETHNYVTKLAECAGEAFELDTNLLDQKNQRIEEQDADVVIELDPNTFKYASGLIDVYRGIEDPFSNELASVKFE